jgi:hypothetical protein
MDNCESGAVGTVVGFQGPFDPSNWNVILNGTGADVDISNAPDEVTLSGPDGGACPLNAAAILEIELTEDVEITFDWEFNTIDAAFWGSSRVFYKWCVY